MIRPKKSMPLTFHVQVNRVNQLAARHQNYGSLFYNQDGFSGALSSMPTPSNLPRMSSEDEALMWDILDLTSSSGFHRPSNDAAMATYCKGPVPGGPESTEEELDGEMNQESNDQGPETPNFLAQDTVLTGGTSQQADEPSSDWPFSQRVGNNTLAAVPDIPDWMIFGDFTEHL